MAASAQSLDTLYAAARGHDASYQSARAQADSVIYRTEQAYALNRPSATLAASSLRSYDHYPGLPEQPSTNTGATISARQPLYNRSNDASIAQADKALASTRQSLEIAEQDLIVRLAQAYFDVLGAIDTLSTNHTSKAAISEQLAFAKRNFEVGSATIVDTREAQSRYDLATAQEIAAENDLGNKRIALDTLVGREGVHPYGLATPVALPELAPGSSDDWVTRAMGQHPNILQARLSLDEAVLETAKARGAGTPTLDAVGSVGSNHASGSSLTTLPGTTTSATVGLQLNVPLFAGYSIQNRIKETLVLEDKSRADLDNAVRSVAQATRQAYFTVRSGLAQVKALEAADASSQVALDATELGYKVGVRVNIDVLNAQTQLFTNRRDLARARYDVLLAGLRLRQAAGELRPDDVASVSRLLQTGDAVSVGVVSGEARRLEPIAMAGPGPGPGSGSGSGATPGHGVGLRLDVSTVGGPHSQ